MKDVLNIALFLIAVVVGAWLVNLFIFRSFNVDGPSMEKTLYTGDRLIVNRLPVTWEHLRGRQFIPNRGQIVVFKNPFFEKGMFDEYIVKRVIAFPGERVVLKDRKMLVYNKENPSGLDVDMLTPDVVQPTHGSVDMTVPDGEIFVAGDHRQASYSHDSRNGLGTIPYDEIIGPVSFRIFPFTAFRAF